MFANNRSIDLLFTSTGTVLISISIYEAFVAITTLPNTNSNYITEWVLVLFYCILHIAMSVCCYISSTRHYLTMCLLTVISSFSIGLLLSQKIYNLPFDIYVVIVMNAFIPLAQTIFYVVYIMNIMNMLNERSIDF